MSEIEPRHMDECEEHSEPHIDSLENSFVEPSEEPREWSKVAIMEESVDPHEDHSKENEPSDGIVDEQSESPTDTVEEDIVEQGDLETNTVEDDKEQSELDTETMEVAVIKKNESSDIGIIEEQDQEEPQNDVVEHDEPENNVVDDFVEQGESQSDIVDIIVEQDEPKSEIVEESEVQSHPRSNVGEEMVEHGETATDLLEDIVEEDQAQTDVMDDIVEQRETPMNNVEKSEDSKLYADTAQEPVIEEDEPEVRFVEDITELNEQQIEVPDEIVEQGVLSIDAADVSLEKVGEVPDMLQESKEQATLMSNDRAAVDADCGSISDLTNESPLRQPKSHSRIKSASPLVSQRLIEAEGLLNSNVRRFEVSSASPFKTSTTPLKSNQKPPMSQSQIYINRINTSQSPRSSPFKAKNSTPKISNSSVQLREVTNVVSGNEGQKKSVFNRLAYQETESSRRMKERPVVETPESPETPPRFSATFQRTSDTPIHQHLYKKSTVSVSGPDSALKKKYSDINKSTVPKFSDTLQRSAHEPIHERLYKLSTASWSCAVSESRSSRQDEGKLPRNSKQVSESSVHERLYKAHTTSYANRDLSKKNTDHRVRLNSSVESIARSASASVSKNSDPGHENLPQCSESYRHSSNDSLYERLYKATTASLSGSVSPARSRNNSVVMADASLQLKSVEPAHERLYKTSTMSLNGAKKASSPQRHKRRPDSVQNKAAAESISNDASKRLTQNNDAVYERLYKTNTNSRSAPKVCS